MTEQIKSKIKFLAKKAANYWNSLTEEQKQEYMDNGTATVFEHVDLTAYMTIVQADNDFSLFDMLEEEFWNLVED